MIANMPQCKNIFKYLKQWNSKAILKLAILVEMIDLLERFENF